MRVALDVSGMNVQSYQRGIGVYAKNLAEAIKRHTEVDITVVERPNYQKVDLVHYPYFDFFNLTLPLKLKFPTVVTVHDCTPLVFPEHYPPGVKGRVRKLIQQIALKKVKAVLTDSKSSKNDITRFLGIEDEKISVVPLAPSKSFKRITDTKLLNKIAEKYKLPERFILYVGGVNWNKNLLNLAKASTEAGVTLVLVGKDFENRVNLDHPELKSFKLFLNKYDNTPLIQIIGFVPDEDLIAITNLASIALLPSFYEGFGLPILQAQLCEVPVITSKTSSMPEVAGEGALFVDPMDYKDIKDAIEKVMSDPSLREALIKKGRKNSSKFSWEISAHKTVEVYQRVMNEN